MTRGNQRELAREKNMKKQKDAQKKKGNNEGMNLEARKHRDAEIMRQKQEKKAAAAAEKEKGK